jgi:drug/metabolite transporter (DMT)-like permease
MPSSLLFVIVTLIWGSTFWAITLQLGEVAPAVSVVYRFGLAAAILFACCLARGDRIALPWRTQRWLALQGALSFCLSYICTYQAEQTVVSALVAVLFALMVFWTPMLNRVLLGIPVARRTVLAGAVAMAGVSLLFFHSISATWRDVLAGGSAKFLLGVALALAATLASTGGNMLVVKIRAESTNLMLATAWAMLWGTLLVMLWCLMRGDPFVLPSTPSYWMSLIYLSLFGSVIAFVFYFTLINRIGAQKAVYLVVLTPVVSVLLSIRLEHYRPGPLEWLGMALCLASVAWALRVPKQAQVATALVDAKSADVAGIAVASASATSAETAAGSASATSAEIAAGSASAIPATPAATAAPVKLTTPVNSANSTNSTNSVNPVNSVNSVNPAINATAHTV